jgi:hypothetical protein
MTVSAGFQPNRVQRVAVKRGGSMRRFVTLAGLLLFTIPFGMSVSGCKKALAPDFCNGSDSGVVVGQVTTLTLQPRLTGISINQGQLGQVGTPAATDCKGNGASANQFIFGTTDMFLADVNPSSGQICAGSWNRNSGAGVADYTTCTFDPKKNKVGTAYVTASAEGVTSNPIAIYVHPIVTSVLLGLPSTNCVTDPASNCVLDAAQTNGCSTAAVPTNPNPAFYTGNACVSQGTLSQLAARAYQGVGNPNPANNISCLVGPLTYSPQTNGIVTINQAGVATAVQPGTTLINANTSQSSSSAGLYSVCPPASIKLTIAGSTATSATINQNVAQNILATVVDTLGAPMNDIALEYVSTTPTTIPVSSSSITAIFPGSTSVTAICQPPTCNPAPINQIGLFGNGKTVVSNPVTITSPGVNSTVLYVGSTNSQYIVPVDFTGNNLGSPVRLPYAPNSMVLSQDLSTIYMGTSTELMIVNAVSSTLAREDNSVEGTVLSVSPDSSTVVIGDPLRKLTYLYSSAGNITGEIGGVGTRAAWTPDSQTVYITTSTGQLLVHSAFTGWKTITPDSTLDVAVTVPSAGAYFSGPAATIARTNCPISTLTNDSVLGLIETNQFYPQSDSAAFATDRIAATNDGKHIIGATVTTTPAKLVDLTVTVPSTLPANACPLVPAPAGSPVPAVGSSIVSGPLQSFSNSPQTVALGATPTAITGVLATSDSAYSFVTYTGTGGVVPQYAPATATLKDIPLVAASGAATPTAPAAGVLSADDQTLFVGTSGDNFVHILKRSSAGFTDASSGTLAACSASVIAPGGITSCGALSPQLPAITGGVATPNLLVQRPRKSTN